MFYRLTALFLIPLLLGANLSRMMVFAGFELNRKLIASSLCENRDKPWMNCNGKCYLDNKLKQVEEKEKKQHQQVQKQLLQDVFVAESFTALFFSCIIQTLNSPYFPITLPGYRPAVFQPPGSSASPLSIGIFA